MDALADRMARAYEHGDVDGVAACYAPDALLWHNFDGSEQTVADQLDATRWLGENLKTDWSRDWTSTSTAPTSHRCRTAELSDASGSAVTGEISSAGCRASSRQSLPN
jgi:hypothetical protein